MAFSFFFQQHIQKRRRQRDRVELDATIRSSILGAETELNYCYQHAKIDGVCGD